MSRKTFRVHRNCGGRVVLALGDGWCPWCKKCQKWLIGDAVELVSKKTGRVVGRE